MNKASDSGGFNLFKFGSSNTPPTVPTTPRGPSPELNLTDFGEPVDFNLDLRNFQADARPSFLPHIELNINSVDDVSFFADKRQRDFLTIFAAQMSYLSHIPFETLQEDLPQLVFDLIKIDPKLNDMIDFLKDNNTISVFLTVFENFYKLELPPKAIDYVLFENDSFLQHVFSVFYNNQPACPAVQDKIAQGSFGAVYSTTKENVVAKINFINDFDRVALLLNELIIHNKLSRQYPNNDCFIKILGHGIENNINESVQFKTFFEKAEYDLKDRKDDFMTDFEQFKQLAVSLATGIVSVHDSGVIHRDIKPENILCTNRQYKIADFGLATELEKSPRNVGDMRYQPAEHNELLSKSSDIYAIGVTLMELGLGFLPPSHPIDSMQPFEKMQVLQTILNSEPEDRYSLDSINTILTNAGVDVIVTDEFVTEVNNCLNSHRNNDGDLDGCKQKLKLIYSLLQPSDLRPNANQLLEIVI